MPPFLQGVDRIATAWSFVDQPLGGQSMCRWPRELVRPTGLFEVGWRTVRVGSTFAPCNRLSGSQVAAFLGRRLRHFPRQGPVKQALRSNRRPVQVKLQLRGSQDSKFGGFGSPHRKCRNGRTPFASSNLARSATISGRLRAVTPSGSGPLS